MGIYTPILTTIFKGAGAYIANYSIQTYMPFMGKVKYRWHKEKKKQNLKVGKKENYDELKVDIHTVYWAAFSREEVSSRQERVDIIVTKLGLIPFLLLPNWSVGERRRRPVESVEDEEAMEAIGVQFSVCNFIKFSG